MVVKNDLCDRLLKFAVDVILYLRTVKNSVETLDMKRQLVKSSTSSGANYEESKGSPTRPDVKTKIGIFIKGNAGITLFPQVFHQLLLGDMKQCEYLVSESSELKLILGSIIKKL
jgi:four helix bundle protein